VEVGEVQQLTALLAAQVEEEAQLSQLVLDVRAALELLVKVTMVGKAE
jgi:hypothetical protein